MITLSDIYRARENISAIVKETPIFTSSELSNCCGNRIFLKGEHLQKTGSFKIRGATNKVKEVVGKGTTFITAASSGNHGQAVAYIANELNVPATIVVPEDVIESKKSAIESYNGKIEKCGRTSTERINRAIELAKEHDGVFIPPYDDPLIIAGQGTVGLEVIEQVENVDIVVVPIGGGGLTSGMLIAMKESNPKIKVIGVEPESANDTFLSWTNNKITSIPPTNTIADGLRASQPGELTFPIIQKYIDDIVLVSDDEIKATLHFVMQRMKQVIEPSGVVTIAAAMTGKLRVTSKNVVTVCSGGNVDIHQLLKLFDETAS